MSDTATAPIPNGNATDPNQAPELKLTALDTIKLDFAKAGSKLADAKTQVKLRDAYVASNAEVAKAEAALTAARNANAVNAKALMLATGAQPLKFGGVLYNPSCRGESVFYKAAGSKDVLEIK